MVQLSEQTKDTAKKMTFGSIGKSLLGGVKSIFSKKPTSELQVDDNLTSPEYLGQIYKMLKIIDEDKKYHQHQALVHLEQEEHMKDQRNKEIIEALTGKKFKRKKFKSKYKFRQPKPTTPSTPTSLGLGGILGGAAAVGTAVVSTGVVVGTGAVLMSSSPAFANTLKMEQSIQNTKQAEEKAHAKVLDRDKSYSFGVFGLSSIRSNGKKNSSLDSFIEDNPQFNLPDPGVGGKDEKFLEAWDKLDTKQLLEAQEKWWIKHVYDPTVRKLETEGVDSKISSDERVRAYMSDRRNQLGATYENIPEALKESGADKSTTPEDFINKMADYDIKTLDKKFPSYLKQYPERRPALIKRVEDRKKLSLGVKSQSSNFVPDPEIEKQRLEYERMYEQGIDMGLNTKPAETKPQNVQDIIAAREKAAEPVSTGPAIPKPTTSPDDNKIAKEQFIERILRYANEQQKIIDENNLAEENARLKEASDEREAEVRSFFLMIEEFAQNRIDREGGLVDIEYTNQSQNIVNNQVNQNTQPEPMDEDFDNRDDSPVMFGTKPVQKQTTTDQLQSKQLTGISGK